MSFTQLRIPNLSLNKLDTLCGLSHGKHTNCPLSDDDQIGTGYIRRRNSFQQTNKPLANWTCKCLTVMHKSLSNERSTSSAVSDSLSLLTRIRYHPNIGFFARQRQPFAIRSHHFILPSYLSHTFRPFRPFNANCTRQSAQSKSSFIDKWSPTLWQSFASSSAFTNKLEKGRKANEHTQTR